jgi:hypothetical protein
MHCAKHAARIAGWKGGEFRHCDLLRGLALITNDIAGV